VIVVEWIRQIRRMRTWACFALLAAVPVIMTVATYVSPPRERRFEINLFTVLTSSGINVAVAALLVMSQFFLVVVVAAFAGESVSGEATWGTLRYLLVRPVSRARLVLAKLGVAYVLTLIAVFVITGTALLAGTIAFGWHEPTVVKTTTLFGEATVPLPVKIAIGEGIGRLSLASGYIALTMLAVVAIGIFLSTLTDSTAAAVVSTVVAVVASGVLIQVPSLSGIKPYLPTRYWDEWHTLFNGGTTADMYKGAASALIYTAIFAVLAVWRFNRKDILS